MINTKIMDAKGIKRSIERIAYEILEHNGGADDMVIIGIRTRGVFLAERVAKVIKRIEKTAPPVGAVDITMYRDDVQIKLDQPIIQKTDLSFSIDDKIVILVDDVLYTGRTVRAALNELSDYGRTRCIQLAVLIDRGHRELPICADYTAIKLQTFTDENVIVNLKEHDDEDSVILQQSNGGEVK
ncbi:MAG: bifunctional pyr operon transcriptional regulator/uracil phosphoribosyltransferase PyrR [candidate division Zixibacteria bacterium]|nr:bifunctional pyr operon transcriptional regulator/uracil phosphoribosyltransferase PyrR [candidate division Zixibacteria bacterium]